MQHGVVRAQRWKEFQLSAPPTSKALACDTGGSDNEETDGAVATDRSPCVRTTTGVDLSAQPQDDRQHCRLIFERVEIPVPVLGKFDIARVLPPIVVPADSVATATGSRGDFEVRSQLVDVEMSQSALRLQFDVTVVSIDGVPR